MDDDESTMTGGDHDAYRSHLRGGADNDNDANYKEEALRLREVMSGGQGGLEGKYLDQVRRNRDLQVRFESEKTKVNKLTARVVSLEKEKAERETMKNTGMLLPSERGTVSSKGGSETPATEGSLAELEEKVERANKTIQLLRKTSDEQKKDIGKLRRVLQLELGADEEQLDTVLRTIAEGGGGGWKGRAQQISLLKGKIKDLERASRCDDGGIAGDGTGDDAETRSELTMRTGISRITTTSTVKDFDDVNRSAVELKQKRVFDQARDLKLRVEEKEKQYEDEKKKSDSLQARLQILERDNQHLKSCIQRVLDKTENDNTLIDAYRQELEELRAESRKLQVQASRSQQPVVEPNAQVETLQRENRKLVETIESLRSKERTAQPLSSNAPSESTVQQALTVVEQQRQTILALEAQMQKRDKATSQKFDSVADCDAAIREENNSLKYRCAVLSGMMEKEIELHKAVAQQQQQQPGGGSTSRPTSGAIAGRRAAPNTTTSGGVPQEEFDSLKRQYDELRRAFNSQQSKKA